MFKNLHSGTSLTPYIHSFFCILLSLPYSFVWFSKYEDSRKDEEEHHSCTYFCQGMS
jgi:hypothetical protein